MLLLDVFVAHNSRLIYSKQNKKSMVAHRLRNTGLAYVNLIAGDVKVVLDGDAKNLPT